MLKLKRNVTSLGFDTFHVLIERRPSTAPNSPQTPAHRGLSDPATPSLSSASRISHGTNGTGLQVRIPQENASGCPSSSASKADSPSHLQEQAKSLDSPTPGMTCAVDPEICCLQPVAASLKLQASQISTLSSTSSVIVTHGSSTFTAPALIVKADDSANGFVDPDSPAARFSHMQVSQNQQLHIENARQMPSQASCNRKLQLDVDAQEPCAKMPSPHPLGHNITTAKDYCSSQFKPIHAAISLASPSASEIVAVEFAVSFAAAAQEKEAVASWISSQAQEISAAGSPPSSGDHEVLLQRLEEQRVWGLVNSKILSDLMKSMGSKSIFHH